MLEALKKYFETTPREEVLKGWEQAKNNAPKCGPTVDEFLRQNKSTECLHDKCENCHGTGTTENHEPCVHMISCPCEKCSPFTL